MIKITKAIRELQIGNATMEEIMQKMGFDVDSSINARIPDDLYEIISDMFQVKELKHIRQIGSHMTEWPESVEWN